MKYYVYFLRSLKNNDLKEYGSRSEAMRNEKYFKTGQQKELLKKKYGQVAK